MHDDILKIFFHRIYGRIRFPVKFRELTISPVRVSINNELLEIFHYGLLRVAESARAFRKLNSEIDGDNSDSSLSASDEDKDSTAKLVDEVEFNPKLYENIDAPSEIKELMQYISRYAYISLCIGRLSLLCVYL